jgi:hypothetical protein
MECPTTPPPDRAIVASPPPEHVNISPTRRRVGVTLSVVGVLGVLVGAFWASVAQALFFLGGISMAASLFLLSPYLRIFERPKTRDIDKLYPRQ